MTRRGKRPRSLWDAFLEGLREGVDDPDDEDDGDSYDPFRYAPGPPFRRRKHPSHVRSIMRWFGRRGHR